MKYERKIFISIFWVILGIVLIGCSMANLIDNFWSGMGGGLLAVGVFQVIRHIKYRTDGEYREKIDVENNDERNKFISGRAWAWAGYTFVMAMSICVIGFKVMGYDEYSTFAAMSVCFVLIAYWVSYLILRKKY